MRKILLIMLCSVFLLSHCVVLCAANGDKTDSWLTVAEDIGTEAHMEVAEKLAADEWWRFFWGILALMVIIIITSYVLYSNNIWAANADGQHEKVKKLKRVRHIMAALWTIVAVAGLITIRIYMQPYNVRCESDTYNTMYWNEVQEGLGDYAKTGNVTLDLIVRKSISGCDDVFGTIIVDETKYVISSDDTVEDEDCYTLIFKEEGGSILDMGVRMISTKDFSMFIYRDASKSGVNEFVGPAKTVEEAQDIYTSINELK